MSELVVEASAMPQWMAEGSRLGTAYRLVERWPAMRPFVLVGVGSVIGVLASVPVGLVLAWLRHG